MLRRTPSIITVVFLIHDLYRQYKQYKFLENCMNSVISQQCIILITLIYTKASV